MATNIPAPDDDTMDSTSTPSGNGKPTKAGRNSKGKGRERREVQALLERGRVKGFLTYDEVNDALPPEMVTSEQIDDLMVWLGNEDIEVVDQASQVKRRPEAQKVKTPTLPPAASEEYRFLADRLGYSADLERLRADLNRHPTFVQQLSVRLLG